MINDIARQMLAVGHREHLAVERTSLAKIIVLGVQGVRGSPDLSTSEPTGIAVALRVGRGTTVAVGSVDGLVSMMKLAHGSILVVAMNLRFGLVDWQLQVVDADAVAVCIRIAEQAPQEHFIRAGTDAGHHVRWLERCLLYLSKEVSRVAIQH